ncbi:MAG: hypothetical protein SFU83_22450 [Meiothermus sp.]|nr:hypothetical protein [Meiothermus sp.]
MMTVGSAGKVGVRARIHWPGIVAGVLAGIVTYLVLSVLGLAVGLLTVQSRGIDTDAGGLGVGTLVYMVLAMALSAFLAGLTAARAAAFLTPAQGRFNGFLTGVVLLLALTWLASNLLFSGLNSALGLASGALNAVAGAADRNTLGAGDAYQAIVNGLDEEEVADLIAQGSPNLSQEQVRAAAATVSSVVRTAGQNIGGSLDNVSNLGQVVGAQVDAVEQALTGPEFQARLQRRGLTQAEAAEVSTVVRQRFSDIRTQATETADALTRTAAQIASAAAWIWLLVAALVLGLATFGGGRGGEVEPVAARAMPERRTTPSSNTPDNR